MQKILCALVFMIMISTASDTRYIRKIAIGVCQDYQTCVDFTQEECTNNYNNVIVEEFTDVNFIPNSCFIVPSTGEMYYNTWAGTRPATAERQKYCYCENTDTRLGYKSLYEGGCTFVDFSTLGQLSLSVCRDAVKQLPDTCNQKFFTHATNGDSECLCFDPEKTINDCTIIDSHDVVVYEIVHGQSDLYEKVDEDVQCFFQKWLGVYTTDLLTCRQVSMETADCTTSFFNYNTITNECACMLIEADCTSTAFNSYAEDIDLYRILGTTNAPSTTPSSAPSFGPIIDPTRAPTKKPVTTIPSRTPSTIPTNSHPTLAPTIAPTTPMPTTAPSINLHSELLINENYICPGNIWLDTTNTDPFLCLKMIIAEQDCSSSFYNHAEDGRCGCVPKDANCWWAHLNIATPGVNIYVVITATTTTLSPTTCPTTEPTDAPTVVPTPVPTNIPSISAPSQSPTRFYDFSLLVDHAICKPYKWLDIYDSDPTVCMDAVRANPQCANLFFSHATLTDQNCGCVWNTPSLPINCIDPINWEPNVSVYIYSIGRISRTPTLQPTPTPSLVPTEVPTREPTESPETPTETPTADPTGAPSFINICTEGTSQDQVSCLKTRLQNLGREVELLTTETETLSGSVKVACEKYRRDVDVAVQTCVV